jgi:anti-sigma factor (TIGR02949 family)
VSDIDYRSCAQVFSRLDDWADRELSADDLEQIQRHLEICAVCASEFRIEGNLLRTIREKVRRIRLPDGLEARVWRRVTGAMAGEAQEEPPPGGKA